MKAVERVIRICDEDLKRWSLKAMCFGNVAYYQSVEGVRPPNSWSVGHVQTGRLIAIVKTKGHAAALAKELAEGYDWDFQDHRDRPPGVDKFCDKWIARN